MAVKWNENNEKYLRLLKDPNSSKQTLQRAVPGKESISAFHNFRNADFSLLFHCVVNNAKIAFEVLLEAGADPTLPNNVGNSVLHPIIKRGLLDWAELAIKGLSQETRIEFLNKASFSGWTPLMSACENNQLRAVEWLLKNGANPNTSMSTGWTALHAAAKKSNYEVLKLLLNYKGDKHKEAAHRDFGRNLKVEDVTTDDKILELLKAY